MRMYLHRERQSCSPQDFYRNHRSVNSVQFSVTSVTHFNCRN